VRIVAAVGGNALSPPPAVAGDRPAPKDAPAAGSVAEMRAALRAAAGSLAALVGHGTDLVLTHGNGPQVGRILLQQEYAAEHVPPMPMDVCGAESQGQIGYLLAQALDTELRRQGRPARVLALVTQVLVNGRDPAFRRPTKPVGPSYDADTARGIAEATGHVFAPTGGGSWRRVVPSPRPLGFVEEAALRCLVDAGHVVVAAGGGGIPVVEHRGELRGVEAVVDKDSTAALLGRLLEAELLLILTAVPRVQVGYGTPQARELTRLTVAEARRLLAAGEFPVGSMGPKVAACADFIDAGGRRAVIAALPDAAAALAGDAGTTIVAGAGGAG
jgi:carbamate kinase